MCRRPDLLLSVQLLHESLHVNVEFLVTLVFEGPSGRLLLDSITHANFYGLEMLFKIDLHRHDIADLQFAKVLVQRMTAFAIKHDRFDRWFDNIFYVLRIVCSLSLLLVWVWPSRPAVYFRLSSLPMGLFTGLWLWYLDRIDFGLRQRLSF